MGDKEYTKMLEEYLNKCSKEELEIVYKEIDKKIIEYITKGD